MTRKQPRRKARPGLDEYGRTSLHYAARDGDEALCRMILAEGGDPNAQDDNGWSPLHFAAQATAPRVAEMLLRAGASHSLRDSFGNTALFRAVFSSRGDGSVISLLRQAGADVFAVNNHGVSPFSLAHTIGNYNVTQFFADMDPRQPQPN
jgi:ankyrin repeat protein